MSTVIMTSEPGRPGEITYNLVAGDTFTRLYKIEKEGGGAPIDLRDYELRIVGRSQRAGATVVDPAGEEYFEFVKPFGSLSSTEAGGKIELIGDDYNQWLLLLESNTTAKFKSSQVTADMVFKKPDMRRTWLRLIIIITRTTTKWPIQ